MPSLAINAKDWNHPRKILARHNTIINASREVLHQSSLPNDLQYWTMCGQLGSDNGIQPGCELDHMVTSGFITPGQFHGVEANPEIHRVNQAALKATPTYQGAHLYCGDFVQAMDTALTDGSFRPGVVYLDMISEPRQAVMAVAHTLNLLNYTNTPVLLAANIVVGNSRFKREWGSDEVEALLRQDELFRHAASKPGWHRVRFSAEAPEYRYGGTGDRSVTTMGTWVYCRIPN